MIRQRRMARRTLDRSIPLFVESSRTTGTHNRYVSLPCVEELATEAFSHPEVLDAIALLVAVKAIKFGYSKPEIISTRRRLMLLCDTVPVQDAIRALEAVAVEYRKECPEGAPAPQRRDVAGQFCSAISETIVLKFLTAAGRRDADITKDARVLSRDSRPINSCNIDFIWASIRRKLAELVECKNQLYSLLRGLGTADFRRSKLWLMLETSRLLVGARWRVRMACVTLRSREAMATAASRLASIELAGEIYCVEAY